MRQRRQQSVANTFSLAGETRLFFAGGQRQSFQRAGDKQRIVSAGVAAPAPLIDANYPVRR